jgi:hypothetical protein
VVAAVDVAATAASSFLATSVPSCRLTVH